jgi:hypothetical protein
VCPGDFRQYAGVKVATGIFYAVSWTLTLFWHLAQYIKIVAFQSILEATSLSHVTSPKVGLAPEDFIRLAT